MNIDTVHAQALALLIMIMIVCHTPHPQLSIDQENTPLDGG